ncbi:hypothetical protein H2200_006357 [Cladophialophora chaetospira]|uniref:MYB family conidiophore development protein FlbD n=1 Tax=Cladophialophora chaetospira TaxID=386627 RepID=A0AA38XAR9_9EURO|nr:hypothetical protein H2200_006357 [Cladophialophora chaetospira]
MSRSSRRGPWLPEEDNALLHLVRTQGPNNWVRISQHMQHRSPKQCRERYHQNLKPSLNHEPISAQEGEVIEQLVHEMGKRWAEIARRLGNRSDNAVKNWWNGSMNRRKRSTVQQGSGSRTVGYRTQPIPASGPPPLLRQHSYLNNESGIKMFSGPAPFHRHGISTSSIFDQGHRYSTISHPHQDSLSIQTSQRPLSYPQHANSPRSMHHPNSSSILSPGGNLLPRLHTWPSGPSDYRLPPLNLVEPAAPSPAATEASHTSSHQQAPSLISDNQSACSISPKTVTSPRPGMPTSKVPSMETWPEMHRRNSTGNVIDDEMEGRNLQRHEHDLQTHRSAGSQDRLFEKVALLPSLPRPSSLPDHTTSRSRLNVPEEGTRLRGEVTSSSQQKDSRMTVSSLLE